MLSANGIPQNMTRSEILRVSKDSIGALFNNDRVAIISDGREKTYSNYVLTSDNQIPQSKKGVAGVAASFLDSLSDGDIVSIQKDGRVNVLYQKASSNNVLFVTDYCNSKCIMCPQIDMGSPENYYDDALTVLKLIADTPQYICISGGEPTILKDGYIKVVQSIQKKFPSIALQVLTNGKTFADFNFSKECILNSPLDTLYSIPLYSGNSALHDMIVQSAGSFADTIKGILNLYRFHQNIEIRVVITKLNYKDLKNIAHFIYWNMPFVFRISFMGMEVHGNAETNLSSVWVEPAAYNNILEEAVVYLANRQLEVMIYNLPHCILNENMRRYAKDSISEWKKTFLKPCNECTAKNKCSGVFTTSSRIPEGIHSI